jgi:hypothetical protein
MLMPRLLLVSAALCLIVVLASAQEAQQSPKEVVEQFYKLETTGKLLGPGHQEELAHFLIDGRQWPSLEAVYVLKGYNIGNERKDNGPQGLVSYSVEVDFDEWGSIDFFLNFNASAAEAPKERTYEILYLSDERWKLSLFAVQRINIDAAIQWVGESREKSNDPAIKYNADKTLAILKTLSAGAPLPPKPALIAKESPTKVARRFVHLEMDSLPEQWDRLSSFFVETPKPQWNEVHVVDIVGVAAGTDPKNETTMVDVSTNSLGDLDSSLRLRNYPLARLPLDGLSASACFGDYRFGFGLQLTEKYWKIDSNGKIKEFDGPPTWRVEASSFEPLITLDTAIRYVRQVSEKTSDPNAKRNAARTLRILNRYKQGRPLQDELSSAATGGCG